MKQASEALINLLHNSDQIYVADLYTIMLIDDTVLRYTSLDKNLTVGNDVFRSFTIDRNNVSQRIGLEVDELSITMYANQNDKLPSGASVLQAMRGGAFDNAMLALEVLFSPVPWQYNMPAISADYKLLHFLGRMDIEEVDGLRAEIKVKALTELLNVKQPRNLVMPSCLHTVYDSRCCIQKTNYAAVGTIGSGSTKAIVSCTLSQPAGYFDMGEILFKDGQNACITRGVRQYGNGRIVLSHPLPYVPVQGDSFTIYPGCDRTKYTCLTRFNNLNNFRGYPYVPTPETLL